jgi:hypothetical protein
MYTLVSKCKTDTCWDCSGIVGEGMKKSSWEGEFKYDIFGKFQGLQHTPIQHNNSLKKYINLKKVDKYSPEAWKCDSSGKVPALQAKAWV